MKGIKNIIGLWSLLLLGFTAYSQDNDHCATPHPERGYLDRIGMDASRVMASHTVKIFVHLVAEDDGSGTPSYQQVYDELDRLEAYYAPHDICFHLMGIDFINDSDYASHPDFDTDVADDLVDDYPPSLGWVDIYILPSYTFFRGTAYGIPNHYLTIYAGRFNTCHMAHEMGHCLGLLHTHETSTGDELVDGSNCGSAGDELCDTPADPQLSSANVDDVTCVYFGTDTDANGDMYNPDVTNTMSYAPFNCRGSFTNDQENRMHGVLGSIWAALTDIVLIDNDLVECCDDHASGTEIFAANNQIHTYDYSVTGSADISMIAGVEVLINEEFVAAPGPGGLYLAQINRYCDGIFPDGVPVGGFAPDVPVLYHPPMQNRSGLNIYPNPSAGPVTVSFELPKAGPTHLYLLDVNGRLLRSVLDHQQMDKGAHTIELSNIEYPNGTYYLKLTQPGFEQTGMLKIIQ